jgi:hypothetical protein
MTQNSAAFSRFPVNPIGKTVVAMLAFAVAFAVAPAGAHDSVALIETLTSPSQRVELMSYARVGEIIRLTPDQTIVLSYRDSCVREIITGGVIKIGREQSEVQYGEVQRTSENCAKGSVEITGGDASGKVYRRIK